jgi:NitT/TauT family transport system substrate-binding protein
MTIGRRDILLGTAASALSLTVAGGARAANRQLIVQAGSPSPNSGFIPLYVSQQLGFFNEEGLDVEVRYTRGAGIAMQLVSVGQADMGFFVYDSLISGYGEGLRGTYFYQYYTHPIFSIGIPADSSIKLAADLAGKRIGVANLGSAGVPIAKSILRSSNVDPGSVSFLPIGVGNQAFVALKGNQVDALCLWDAPFGSLEVLGANLRFIAHPKLSGVGSGGYVASPKVILDREADLIGFGRAVAKGTAFVLRNPEAAIRMYWKANPSGRQGDSDAAAMKIALTETKYIFENIRVTAAASERPIYGNIKLAELQQYIDVNAIELGVKSPPRAEDIATTKLVAPINQFDLSAVEKMAMSWSK